MTHGTLRETIRRDIGGVGVAWLQDNMGIINDASESEEVQTVYLGSSIVCDRALFRAKVDGFAP
jgi:hypothetical protein